MAKEYVKRNVRQQSASAWFMVGLRSMKTMQNAMITIVATWHYSDDSDSNNTGKIGKDIFCSCRTQYREE